MPPYDPFNTRIQGKDQSRVPVVDPLTANPVKTQSISVPLNLVPRNTERQAAPFSRATFEAMFAPQQESPLLAAMLDRLNPAVPGYLATMLALSPQAQPLPATQATAMMAAPQRAPQQRQAAPVWSQSGSLPSNWATPQASYSGRTPGGQGYQVSGNTVSWTTPSGQTFTAPRAV